MEGRSVIFVGLLLIGGCAWYLVHKIIESS